MTSEVSHNHGVEFFPIAIGEYEDPGYDPLDVDTHTTDLHNALGDFNATLVPWCVAMNERGGDAVKARLRQWANHSGESARNTVLYWAGHGWSDGHDAASLAHYLSPYPPEDEGLQPSDLATKLTQRESGRGSNGTWAMVIIEACQSLRFVELVNAALDKRKRGARRVLLVASADDGTRLGHFTRVLRGCLDVHFPTNPRIGLPELALELERWPEPMAAAVAKRGVTDAHIMRAYPLPTPVALDARADLKAVLEALPSEERWHYISKAQGAELGESLWFFEGRTTERQAIVDWLTRRASGMLIVTGEAGTGKSALLGNLLAMSRPALRDVLIRRGFQSRLRPEELPQANVFTMTIVLTGATVDTVMSRLCVGLGLGDPPAADVSTRIGWLVDNLRARSEQITLLVDALDEAQQPVAIARSLLARLAGIDGVRLIIGTRKTDRSATDPTDIVEALSKATPEAERIVVTKDGEAVRRYVRRRLRQLLEDGELDIDVSKIEQVARLIASLEPEFLYARLAVHELRARPDLLRD